MRPHAWLLALVVLLCPRVATAQVETDGSLGPAGVVPGGVLPDGTLANWRIDESLGQRRGGNLFHSFRSFNVSRPGTAGFTADLPTQRILARVTEGGASVIDGRLVNAVPGADLYLMNPRGVIFSTEATLDVQGSVYVSSADALRLSDGGTFSAQPIAGETLTVAAPAAWGFSGGDASVIRFTLGHSLSVPRGATFSAVGGTITGRGSSSAENASLAAPSGRIDIVARIADGEIPLDAASIDARNAAPGELGQIALGANFTLDVSDDAPDAARGRIVIRSSSFALGRSDVLSESTGDAPDGANEIDIEATDSIDVSGSNVLASGLGSANVGAVRLDADSIRIADGSRLGSRAEEQARAGRVDLSADALRFETAALVESSAAVDGTGNLLRIRGGSLAVLSGAQVSGTTEGTGRAADVEVDVTGDVLVSGSAPTGPSGLFARSGLGPNSGATGDGGDIRIAANRVSVENAAEISAQSYGVGSAGSISIAARESVRVASIEPFSASINSKVADASGGSIAIETSELVVERGGFVSATTNGLGDAGDVVVGARRIVVGGGEVSPVGGAGIFAQALGTATGDGGDVRLAASERLDVIEDGSISVSTRGRGNAGVVRIDDTDLVSVREGSISGFTEGEGRGGFVAMKVRELRMDGGTITTEARSVGVAGGVGAGGEVAIETSRDVSLDGGATIGATTNRTGQAGTVRVRVGGDLSLAGGSQITTQTRSLGAAGDVFVDAGREVRVANGSAISSDSSGTGDAGTIEIDAGRRVRVESGGRISSQTSLTGDGGSIDVRAKAVSLGSGGSISAASSGDGDAGSVRISAGTISVGRDARITSETEGVGAGGDVDLRARREVTVANGGEITARSGGASNAGDVRIDAGDELTVRDGGRITTQADAAFGGNIDLRARRLLYVRDGEITTSVNAGEGNGGNITIDPKFVVLNGGRIEARANAGNGGNITVTADHFLADVDSAVDASSELGIDGQVQISAPEANLTSELAQLEAEYLDASAQLARACAARSGQGTFRVVGGAKPSSPDAPLESAAWDEASEPTCR